MKDHVCHDLAWPRDLSKLHSDILKFEGKSDEDPGDHFTTFHLWCSSNSLNDDSVHLRLFQRTLTGVLTIKITTMNSSRKGLLNASLFNYDNNIILVGRTPL